MQQMKGKKSSAKKLNVKLNVLLATLCIIVITQLSGCCAPARRIPPVKEITPQERVHIEKIKKDLPRIHAALLNAAAPLSKKKECNFPLEIVYNDKIPNAYCDGNKVYITETMLRNFKSSEEAAITLSHEISHGLMGHIRAKQINTVNPHDFELEADYVGLYLMARAGLPVSRAAQFWRKMALISPSHIRSCSGSSHPSTAQRYVLLEKTAQEINEKKRLKMDLIPEYKNKKRALVG